MRKGVIVYLTEGKEAATELDLSLPQRDWDADEVHLAVSEAEVAWGHWQLLARGMRHVRCVRARYDEGLRTLEPQGVMRLSG